MSILVGMAAEIFRSLGKNKIIGVEVQVAQPGKVGFGC
jgi:hypothetical protein